jgi:peptide/nickel transport system ATP-binding protein
MSLLSAAELSTHYRSGKGTLRAVDHVSLTIETGETVALVGESGCGKSTLGKTLLRLIDPTFGTIVFRGRNIAALRQNELRTMRKSLQMIFQDPFASLNPRHTVRNILAMPLKVHGVRDKMQRRRRVEAMIDRVGLPREGLDRYPHEFSGGQRQRIGIARALILHPELVVCDEPVSALDLSIQAQILNLLVEMKQDLGLSYLFISHDLSVVRYVADRVLVMYLGKIVESADVGMLWAAPRHPYTRALMDAVPAPARRKQAPPIMGDLPSPEHIPTGCRFHPRCQLATDLCRSQEPEFRTLADGHQTACHHAG